VNTTKTACIDDPLLWTEGMLLTPQHLQQNDLYVERQALHQLQQVQPFYWGLLDLGLDKNDLELGRITLTRVRAVMPDGLVIQLGEAYGRPAELSIELADFVDLDSMKQAQVHLRVPIRSEGSASGQGAAQRFDTVEGRLEVDETNMAGQVQVDRMRAQVDLWVGDKVSDKYVSIALCQVVKTPSSQFELSPQLPPLLSASASDFMERKSLQKRLEQLTRKLRHNAGYLAATQQISPRALFAFTVALPPLEVLVKSRCAHPFELLKTLSTLYGQLATLQANPLPAEIPAYNHDRPAASLLTVMKHIYQLINSIPLTWQLHRFQRGRDRTFWFNVAEGWNVDEMIIEVKPAPGQSAEYLERWMERARIGSRPVLELLKRQRSPGASYEPLTPEAQSRVTKRGDAQLYQLGNQQLGGAEALQPVIQAGEALVVIGDDDLTPPQEIIYYQPVKNGEA